MFIAIDWAIGIIGVLLGIYFIYNQIREAHTLLGSAFKHYHYWTATAAGIFALAFMFDLIAIANFDILTFDIIHNFLLLVSAIIFVLTNVALPKEASRYLERHDKR